MTLILGPLFIILALILINGIFVAAEFAVAGANHTRVDQMAEAGSKSAQQIAMILRNSTLINRYLSTAQVGITLASLGLGMYAEPTLAAWFYTLFAKPGWLSVATSHTVASVVGVIFLTGLHVVLGEMAPKSFALQSADTMAVRLIGFMTFAGRLFLPLTSFLTWSGETLLRWIGVPPVDAATNVVSSVELAYIVEESAESGLLEPKEQVYLENVLDFHDRIIGQVMTPRTRMQALPVDATEAEVRELIKEHRYSRYPVYAEDRDHILGILHIKDLARRFVAVHEELDNTEFHLATLVRSAVFAPDTLPLEQMLIRFRREHIQIAIVVDEFGGTAGLITLEDLVEELIGEIQDESDQELPPFEEIAERTLRVRGDLLLGELNQHYGLALEHEEAETVGGLIMALLGHVSEPGEHVTYMDVDFEVDSMEGLAVTTALVHLPETTQRDQAEEAQHD